MRVYRAGVVNWIKITVAVIDKATAYALDEAKIEVYVGKALAELCEHRLYKLSLSSPKDRHSLHFKF